MSGSMGLVSLLDLNPISPGYPPGAIKMPALRA
jgi:hypothetical protein